MENLFILSTTAAGGDGVATASRTINEKTFISKSLTTIDCCQQQPIHTISTTLSSTNNNNNNCYCCYKNHYNTTNIIAQKQSKNNYQSYENILRPHNIISASTSCININATTNYERNLCQNYAVVGGTVGDENFTKKNLKFKSNVVAKKGKFWKFLEEEKWKKTNADDFQKDKCGKCNSSSGSSSR